MAVKLYLLFALACAVILVDQAYAVKRCNTAAWGSKDGYKRELTPTYLTPDIQTWHIFLPIENQLCYGAEVKVCDEDVAPSIRFKSHYDVLVERLSNLQDFAVVSGFVYCEKNRGPASVIPKLKAV